MMELTPEQRQAAEAALNPAPTTPRDAEALDSVYTERNKCVILALRMAVIMGLPAGIGFDEQAEESWKHVVYIDLPTGQVSWHIPYRFLLEVLELGVVPAYLKKWDGHTTEQKYQRVMTAFAPAAAAIARHEDWKPQQPEPGVARYDFLSPEPPGPQGHIIAGHAPASDGYEMKAAEIDEMLRRGEQMIWEMPDSSLPPAVRKMREQHEMGARDLASHFPENVQRAMEPGADPQPLIDFLNGKEGE
jgi:hypothetical protein